eukprot:gene3316-3593_t
MGFVGTDLAELSFLQALQDQSMHTIMLTGDYHVGDEFDKFVGAPLPITRNITLTAAQRSLQQPVLDLNFANSVVQLCASCIFSIVNITIKNERRGTGPYFDIFTGKPGSRVMPYHCHRWHLACTTAPESAETINSLPRSQILPDPNGTQRLQIQNVSFRGREFPDSLIYENVSFDVPVSHQEGRGFAGGYAVGCTGGIRICDSYVSRDCLVDKTPDLCVVELTNKLYSQAEGVSQGPAGTSPGVLAAAIVVPLVVAGLLAALVVLFVRKRKMRMQQQLPSVAAPYTKTEDHNGSLQEPDDRAIRGRESCSIQLLRHPTAVLGNGWQLISSITSPLVGPVEDVTIEFGDLLGSGSFGRVFAARWAGRHVAVKVIEHSSETVSAVESEMQLMFSFNHDNIVRAYYSSTYVRNSCNTTTCSEYSNSSMLQTQSSVPTDCNGTRERRPSSSAGAARAVVVPFAAGPPDESHNSNSDGRHAPDQPSKLSDTVLTRQAQQNPLPPPQLAIESNADKQQQLYACTPPRSGGSAGQAGTVAPGIANFQNSKQSSRGSAGKAQDKRAETYLVEEFCDSGTLTQYMSQFQGALPCNEEVLLRLLLLLKDTANGLACLHSSHVVHGDLNARNVLVASSDKSSTGVVAKVSDLGLSRVIKHHETHRTTNTVGTMSHMPPELLRYGRMSPAADIYAFGVMMWELHTGQPAFRKLQYGQFFETVVLRNLRPMIPQGMPADYQLLMEHCWATDPECRPSVDRLLECLRFMIRERQDSDEEASPSGLQHSKSAPSPMALLKQLPDKRKQGTTDGTGAGAAQTGFEDAAVAAADIHNSFSGLILGPDVVVGDTGSKQPLPQVSFGATQQQYGVSNGSLTGGYLGASVPSTPASTAGLPPRPVVRPGSTNYTSSSNQGWTVPPEQSWFV